MILLVVLFDSTFRTVQLDGQFSLTTVYDYIKLYSLLFLGSHQLSYFTDHITCNTTLLKSASNGSHTQFNNHLSSTRVLWRGCAAIADSLSISIHY